MSVSPPLPLSSSAVAQPAVAVGKPAGMLVVVVRDSAGGLWIWSYERNRTPHSPPNRGVLGGEREAADLVESARSGVAASAVAMMREVGEESVMTPAWRRLVEAAVGRCPLGDTVTQLAPDKLESNAVSVWAVELEPHMQVVPRIVAINGVQADRDMVRARKFEWVKLEVFLNGVRTLYDRGQFANAVVSAVDRLQVSTRRGQPQATPTGDHVVWGVAAPEAAAVLEARSQRFQRPVDAQASAVAVQVARRASFAHVPSGNVTIHMPAGSQHRTWRRPVVNAAPPQKGLLLFIGGQREGDMEWHAKARQVPTRCVDKRQPVPCDVDAPGVTAGIIAECRAKQYSFMHSSFMCFSWSAALSLPPGGSPPGTAPIGPYRGADSPRALPWVKQPLLGRLRQSDAHMRLTLVCGKLIHDAGGSATIESTPDSRDPANAWFLSRDGYDSSNQHPVWEDPLMKEYIIYTESELVTRPMCAAGSPYRAFRTLCMNKKAIAGSEEYRALACTHQSHVQMRGRDVNGVWHGEHAERYTTEWCGVLDRIHQVAAASHGDNVGDGDGDSGSDSDSDSGSDSDSDDDASSSPSNHSGNGGGSGSDSDSDDKEPSTDSDEEASHQQQQSQQQPQQRPAQQPDMQPASAAGAVARAANVGTSIEYFGTPRESNSKIVVSHSQPPERP